MMNDTTSTSVSRRSVAKGAAWATPALALAAAAPPMAASAHPNASVTSATGCKPKTKRDQVKDYWLKACFVNNDSHTVTISAPMVMKLAGTKTLLASGAPSSLSLAPGATGCIVMHATHSTSKKGSLEAIFTVTDSFTNATALIPAFVPKKDVGVDCTNVTGCPDGSCP